MLDSLDIFVGFIIFLLQMSIAFFFWMSQVFTDPHENVARRCRISRNAPDTRKNYVRDFFAAVTMHACKSDMHVKPADATGC